MKREHARVFQQRDMSYSMLFRVAYVIVNLMYRYETIINENLAKWTSINQLTFNIHSRAKWMDENGDRFRVSDNCYILGPGFVDMFSDFPDTCVTAPPPLCLFIVP